MNTTDGNTKFQMKVDYEDTFEDNDKGIGTENDENDTKTNTMLRSTKAKKKVE